MYLNFRSVHTPKKGGGAGEVSYMYYEKSAT